ncbi:MAG: TRAP transporter small permease subunit [Gammaproteobacteria bacterium]|nr:TRAP transporter small permease subunit [Gammaproteobacteria bacterium]
MNTRFLTALADRLDTLSEWTGRAVAWLTLGTVLATFSVVVLRYGFNLSSTILQESILYLHATVFMLGAAYTLKQGGHVRVDIFYRKLSPASRAWVDLAGVLFLLLPVCVFLFWVSGDYVSSAWSVREGSRESGGLPWVYLLKTVIPLMAALLILQGISQLCRSLAQLLGEDTA